MANTALSQTLHRLRLHRVRLHTGEHYRESDSVQANTARSQTIVFGFGTSPSPGNLGSICLFFEIILNIFNCEESDSVQANIMRSQLLNFPEIQKGLTLRGVVLRSVHDNRESDYFKNVCFLCFRIFSSFIYF